MILLLVFLLPSGCTPQLDKLSPTEIVKLVFKAQRKKDKELLTRLVWFEKDMDANAREAIISKALGEGNTEFGMLERLFSFIFRFKLKGERIHGDKAYVYVGVRSILTKWRPYAVMRLEKQDGIWKLRGDRRLIETPEVWRRQLQEDPDDLDALYYLGHRFTKSEYVTFISSYQVRGKPYGRATIYLPHDITRGMGYLEEYLRRAPQGFWAPIIESENLKPVREMAADLHRAAELLKTNPRNSEALATLAQYYSGSGVYRKGRLAAQLYLEVAPNDNKYHRVEKFQDFLKTGYDFEIGLQKDYFDKHPEKLKEVEEELGFKLFEGEVTLP